jgi:hypothetical protein
LTWLQIKKLLYLYMVKCVLVPTKYKNLVLANMYSIRAGERRGQGEHVCKKSLHGSTT